MYSSNLIFAILSRRISTLLAYICCNARCSEFVTFMIKNHTCKWRVPKLHNFCLKPYTKSKIDVPWWPSPPAQLLLAKKEIRLTNNFSRFKRGSQPLNVRVWATFRIICQPTNDIANLLNLTLFVCWSQILTSSLRKSGTSFIRT